jgi:hypothetical protein
MKSASLAARASLSLPLLGLVAALVGGCGTKSKNDGQPAGPGDGAGIIPGGFVSSAKSQADVASAFTSDAQPTLNGAGSALQLTSSTAALTDTATATATSTATSTSASSAFGMPSPAAVLATLGSHHAAGADCGDLVTMLQGQFAAMESALAQQSTLGSLAGTATGTGTSIYTETSSTPTDPRFGFDEKLTRNPIAANSSDPAAAFAALLPETIEIEGGASGQQVALKANVTWDIKPSATSTAASAGANTELVMDLDYSVYADGAAQAIKYGMSGTMTTSGAQSGALKFDGTTTLTGGASPSLVSATDITGTEGGHPIDAHVTFSLTKDADGSSYDLALTATDTGQASVNETLKLQRSAGACKVE